MTMWEDLKHTLAELAAADPVPLTSWPDPDSDNERQPPFDIELEPWATEVAQDLHARFGADVRLTVGALRFPERELAAPRADLHVPLLDPGALSVELDGPLSLPAGDLAHHGLLVANRGDRDVVIGTTGELIADLTDLESGQVVGGYAGPVRLMLTTFTVRPGETERVPLLVASASFVPDLGYAVPAGRWGVQATLDPAAGRPVRTPPLAVTITG
jgi:hypothetical protein